jgi:hypothetical protein
LGNPDDHAAPLDAVEPPPGTSALDDLADLLGEEGQR